MGDTIDLETRRGVRILCELGDSADCGLAVFCRAEQGTLPTKQKHPQLGVIDNPSVVKFCAGQPVACPSRQAFYQLKRDQIEEAVRARRAEERERDAEAEVLEEFTKPFRAKE